jgi:hypothetical protein
MAAEPDEVAEGFRSRPLEAGPHMAVITAPGYPRLPMAGVG